jgi:hypothetical protein
VREYRCTGCGVVNRAINDLTGLRHTQTGRKPSECEGHYEPSKEVTPAEAPRDTAVRTATAT